MLYNYKRVLFNYFFFYQIWTSTSRMLDDTWKWTQFHSVHTSEWNNNNYNKIKIKIYKFKLLNFPSYNVFSKTSSCKWMKISSTSVLLTYATHSGKLIIFKAIENKFQKLLFQLWLLIHMKTSTISNIFV